LSNNLQIIIILASLGLNKFLEVHFRISLIASLMNFAYVSILLLPDVLIDSRSLYRFVIYKEYYFCAI